MLKFDVLPYRHMGIGRQRRTQGTTGRKPLFFVASGFMPDDGVHFFVASGLTMASHTGCDATNAQPGYHVRGILKS